MKLPLVRRAAAFAGVALVANLLGGGAVRAWGGEGAVLADLSLEQLMDVTIDRVYGASRYDQKVTLAPASITILPETYFTNFGYRTLADALRSVRGLFVANDRNYPYLGFRGFLRPSDYNSRVLVLVDGHRVNDPIFDSALIDREGGIDAGSIQRVEVIRGPSSSIYGSSALLGVINVTTKRGHDLAGGHVTAEVGDRGTFGGRVAIGNVTANGVEWSLFGSQFETDGNHTLYYPEFDERISDNPLAADQGVARNVDSERASQISTSLSFRGWTFSGFYHHRLKQIPTASYVTRFNDPGESTLDTRGYADLHYQRELAPDAQISGRIYYDRYTNNGTYPSRYFYEDGSYLDAMYRDGSTADWLGTEWQLTARLREVHTLVLGGEYRQDLRAAQFAYDDVEPRYVYLDHNNPGRTMGLFAQGEIELRRDLLLSSGLRYDHYFRSFGGTFNPRLGLIYHPLENNTLKLLYGRAFRAPNRHEIDYGDYSTPLALGPELIRTWELAYEHYFGSKYRVALSAYRYVADGLISQTEDAEGYPYYANLDGMRSNGVEIEFETDFEGGATLRVSGALQEARDRSSAQRLSHTPRELAAANLAVPFAQRRFFVGMEFQYVGSMLTLAGAHTGGFTLANVTLRTAPRRGFEYSVSLFNVLDREYSSPAHHQHAQDTLAQDGRSAFLRVTRRF